MEGTSYASQGGYQEDSAPRTTALEHLDQEIERLERVIDLLRHRLAPVSERGVEATLEHVRPEPRSHIEGKVQRLAELIGQIDRIIVDLDI